MMALNTSISRVDEFSAYLGNNKLIIVFNIGGAWFMKTVFTCTRISCQKNVPFTENKLYRSEESRG